jgi:hypothetical protein
MANGFGKDILIQVWEPREVAKFYVDQLGFTITEETPELIALKGPNINLHIERGPKLGPVLEVTVENIDEAKKRLQKLGCYIIKDEPKVPRCYIQDMNGLIYNLTTREI